MTDRVVDPSTGEIIEAGDPFPPAPGGRGDDDSFVRDAMQRFTGDLLDTTGAAGGVDKATLNFLTGLRDEVSMNSANAQLGIISQIINANDLDAVLTQTETVKAADVYGQPLEVHGVRYLVSDFGEGMGVYAAIDATHPFNGDRCVVTCGGANVIAQLWRIRELGSFPCKVAIEQRATPTKSGFRPLRLVPA